MCYLFIFKEVSVGKQSESQQQDTDDLRQQQHTSLFITFRAETNTSFYHKSINQSFYKLLNSWCSPKKCLKTVSTAQSYILKQLIQPAVQNPKIFNL